MTTGSVDAIARRETASWLNAGEADAAFDRACQVAAAALRVPIAFVKLADGGWGQVRSGHGASVDWERLRRTRGPAVLLARVLGTSRTWACPDIEADPVARSSELSSRLRLRAVAVAPLRVLDEHMVGGLFVGDHEPRAWTPEDERLLAHLAELVGRELEARLLEHAHGVSEDALRHAERRLRLALTLGGVAAFEWDTRTGMLRQPGGLASLLGRPEADAPRTLDALIGAVHPEDREATTRALHAAVASAAQQPRCAVRCRVRRIDGTERWVELEGEFILDPLLRPTQLLGTLRDITERRRVEQAYEEQRRLLEGIMYASPFITYVYHVEQQRTLYANRDLGAILGYRAAGMAPDERGALAAIIHPDDALRVQAHHVRLAAADDGAVLELEYRVRHADGGWRWFLSRDTPFRREGDGSTVILGMAADVTERVTGAQRIADSEARLRLLAENMRDLVCRHAADGRFTYISPSSAEVVGWRPEELAGRDPYDFIHPEDVARVRREATDANARLALPPTPVTYRFRRPDGTYRWLETVSRPLDEAGGHAVALQTSSRDVTERLELEQQLRESQKLEAVGRLAGGIAHDFNNVLTVVRANTGLLLTEELPPHERLEVLDEVREAAERAAALTQQLLAFGRRQLMQSVPLDVNEMVRRMQRMLRRLLGDEVVIETALDDAAPWTRADPSQLEQVLLNTALNARDAMARGGTLTLATRAELVEEPRRHLHGVVDPGRYVVVEVRDTGDGMDAEALERCFEPFFTTRPATQGTGLGLATVYGIVRQSGGHALVHSARGLGTTFAFYLRAEGVLDPVRPAREPRDVTTPS
ncbi:MAG: PAS domain-containing protein [Gemmatimonadales bacterium]|nr:PAS domain-containing protein [Gemmatimonadales bacterium]